jgi:hypothetical protein
VLLLHKITIALRDATSVRHRRVLCAVVRHEFALPLDRLHDLCVAEEVLTGDVRLAAILEQSAAEFAAGWEASAPEGLSDPQRMLADLDAVIRTAPDRVALRVPHARLLLWAGRPTDAYAAAADAVARLSATEDGGDEAQRRRTRVRDLLAGVIEDVAGAEINRATAESSHTDAVAVGRDAMTRYPLSVAPVTTVARGLAAKDDPDQAVALLSERLRTVATERQARALRVAVRGLHAADAAVQRHIHQLWRRATGRVRAERSDQAVRAAIADLSHAVTLARARGLGRDAHRLDAELDRLRRPPVRTGGPA